MNLFNERYHITRETAEEIMYQYFHPSRKAARARQEMMNEIRKSMRTKEIFPDGSEVIEYDDLDLSWLIDSATNLF